MENVKEIAHYECGKCNVGVVTEIITRSKSGNSWAVNKCSNCKYHYGVKEFSYANLKEK